MLPPEAAAPPWYRQPYVWMLIAFPAAAVAAGVTTLIIAVKTYDGLVMDDYYKRGMEINRELDRDHAATARGLGVAVEFEPGAPRFRIVLAADPEQTAPGELRVSFLHRTRAGFDRQVSALLQPGPAGITPFLYEAAAPDLARGHWDVLIEAADWRLLDSVTVP